MATALWALAGFAVVVGVKANTTAYQVRAMAFWYDNGGGVK